jgi:hypothetical protein
MWYEVERGIAATCRKEAQAMATPRQPMNDRAAGQIMLNEVFNVVERLNATAGPSMVKTGGRSGNMTFNPKIVIDEDGNRQYTCFVEIYTPASEKAGTEISMEWSSADTNQFKQALTILFPALSGLAKEGYISDTLTVGLITPDSEEVEVYTPDVLEPGMYSLKDALEEGEE